jgi:hydroxyethylthiazole kinase-like uncharacterized protein yjeF
MTTAAISASFNVIRHQTGRQMTANTTLSSAAAEFAAVSAAWVRQQLPARALDAHKADFGHVLVVGGDHGFGGAAIMAAQAAVHSGTGLVSLYTRPEHINAMLSRQPEVMAHAKQLKVVLQRASVLLLGPGLGVKNWGKDLLSELLLQPITMLLDADALNYLASLSAAQQQQLKRDNWVLTPHPGEAARLLNCDIATVQLDRHCAVLELQQRFGGTVLLKGHGTLICGPAQRTARLNCGNPGMASGGMGDVLSGVIAALMAQGLDTFTAACAGAWLHSSAADKQASLQGERGLRATAILAHLPQLLNGKA